MLSSLLVGIISSAVILCKPRPDSQPPQSQLTVLPHVEIINPGTPDQKSSAPAISPVPSNPSPSNFGIHLEEVHDVQSNTDAPNTQGPKAPQCPRLYKPVCGSDNKTYNSPCELETAQGSDSNLKQAKDGPC
ncbi:unnamed protein product [Allacma fusca]|uniref:Kazal-like domain-containing protein n=1 Tax=Allacma fusca TaxID=39272 RepID=A0A8J2LHH8_9HEXA|nr:unnamed protein product [Allacma fusca]